MLCDYHSFFHEIDETTSRRLYVNQGIMRSLEKFSKEVTMKLRKFRWFIGKSSSLKLTIICRTPHRTEGFLWRIVTPSTESLEFVGEDFFIVFDIMTRDEIRTIEDLEDFFDMRRHRELICDIFIVDTVDLRSSEWDRNRWFDQDIVSGNLSIFTIFIFSLDRGKLDDVWLLCEISSFRRESCRFCIPDGYTHNILR